MPNYNSSYTGQQIDSAIQKYLAADGNGGIADKNWVNTNYLSIATSDTLFAGVPRMTLDTYPTLLPTSGENNWIKIGTQGSEYGLLPSEQGGASGGHNYIGTAQWQWKESYINDMYGRLKGTFGDMLAAKTIVFPSMTVTAGWRRLCKIGGNYPNAYGWGFIGLSGSWNYGRPTVAIVNFVLQHTNAALGLVGAKLTGTLITQLRLVYEASGIFWLDVYCGASVGGPCGPQPITIFGNCDVTNIDTSGAIFSTSVTAAASLSL